VAQADDGPVVAESCDIRREAARAFKLKVLKETDACASDLLVPPWLRPPVARRTRRIPYVPTRLVASADQFGTVRLKWDRGENASDAFLPSNAWRTAPADAHFSARRRARLTRSERYRASLKTEAISP